MAEPGEEYHSIHTPQTLCFGEEGGGQGEPEKRTRPHCSTSPCLSADSALGSVPEPAWPARYILPIHLRLLARPSVRDWVLSDPVRSDKCPNSLNLAACLSTADLLMSESFLLGI